MRAIKLLQSCYYFEKFAQQQAKKIILDPKKKNIDFWGNFLYNAVISYANYLFSPQAAKNVFDDVAQNLQAGGLAVKRETQNIDMILTALQEAETKLQQLNINPVDVFKRKGMANINPNILNILKNNLQVLKEGKDFSKYQHFYLQKPGQPKEVIELDQSTPDKYETGY